MAETSPQYSPIALEPHTVEDLAVICSDFRVENAYNEVLAHEGVHKRDRIIYPGPSLNITNSRLIPGAKLLNQAHDAKTLRIGDHTYCGGMMDAGKYTADHTEEEMAEITEHEQNEAVEVVRLEIPDAKIITYILGVSGLLSRRIHD